MHGLLVWKHPNGPLLHEVLVWKCSNGPLLHGVWTTLAWGTCLEALEWTTLALSVIAFKRHDSTQLQAQWNFWRGFIHVLAQTVPYTCLLKDFCMPHRKWESKN